MLKKFLVGLALSLVVGCSTLVAPKSFDQQLAYAASSVTAVANSTADLRARNRISLARSVAIEEQLETASVLLSNARIAKQVGQPKDATDMLVRANKILLALEKQLKETE